MMFDAVLLRSILGVVSRLCRSLFTESQKPPSQRFPHPGHCFCLVHVHVETQPDKQHLSTNALESCKLDPGDVTNLGSSECHWYQMHVESGLNSGVFRFLNSAPTMIHRTKEGWRKRKRTLRSRGLGKALTCSEARRARQFWRLWHPWHRRHGHICSSRDCPGASSSDAVWCGLTVDSPQTKQWLCSLQTKAQVVFESSSGQCPVYHLTDERSI